jgi:hypothetical protein
VLALSIDWSAIVRALLFAFFSVFTAIVAAVTGPTYDNLLVPMLQPSALFPPVHPGLESGGDYLSTATQFSAYLVVNAVDPAVGLVAVGVAVLYLVRSFVGRARDSLSGLLPRLVVAVLVANFTVPIATGVLDLAGTLYPVVSGWNGGAWQHWANLAGWGEISFSWDNGAVAFVLSLVQFFAVLALVVAVGVRDALLSVLLVVLPLFTLLWPLRPFSVIPRRAWLLFLELAFLPCVLVVPLQLAVGTTSPVLLVAYLGLALASPYLLSVAGSHLSAFGFPGVSALVSGGVQRGLGTSSAGVASYASGPASAVGGSGAAGRAVAATVRVGGSTAFPAAAPLAVGTAVGHAATHLFAHVRSGGAPRPRQFPPMGGGGGR